MTDVKGEFASEIAIIFDYMDGKLSLDEAIHELEGGDLCYREIREFLLQQPRFNVYHMDDHKSVTH